MFAQIKDRKLLQRSPAVTAAITDTSLPTPQVFSVCGGELDVVGGMRGDEQTLLTPGTTAKF